MDKGLEKSDVAVMEWERKREAEKEGEKPAEVRDGEREGDDERESRGHDASDLVADSVGVSFKLKPTAEGSGGVILKEGVAVQQEGLNQSVGEKRGAETLDSTEKEAKRARKECWVEKSADFVSAISSAEVQNCDDARAVHVDVNITVHGPTSSSSDVAHVVHDVAGRSQSKSNGNSMESAAKDSFSVAKQSRRDEGKKTHSVQEQQNVMSEVTLDREIGIGSGTKTGTETEAVVTCGIDTASNRDGTKSSYEICEGQSGREMDGLCSHSTEATEQYSEQTLNGTMRVSMRASSSLPGAVTESNVNLMFGNRAIGLSEPNRREGSTATLSEVAQNRYEHSADIKCPVSPANDKTLEAIGSQITPSGTEDFETVHNSGPKIAVDDSDFMKKDEKAGEISQPPSERGHGEGVVSNGTVRMETGTETAVGTELEAQNIVKKERWEDGGEVKEHEAANGEMEHKEERSQLSLEQAMKALAAMQKITRNAEIKKLQTEENARSLTTDLDIQLKSANVETLKLQKKSECAELRLSELEEEYKKKCRECSEVEAELTLVREEAATSSVTKDKLNRWLRKRDKEHCDEEVRVVKIDLEKTQFLNEGLRREVEDLNASLGDEKQRRQMAEEETAKLQKGAEEREVAVEREVAEREKERERESERERERERERWEETDRERETEHTGKLARLAAEVEGLKSGNARLESEIASLQERLEREMEKGKERERREREREREREKEREIEKGRERERGREREEAAKVLTDDKRYWWLEANERSRKIGELEVELEKANGVEAALLAKLHKETRASFAKAAGRDEAKLKRLQEQVEELQGDVTLWQRRATEAEVERDSYRSFTEDSAEQLKSLRQELFAAKSQLAVMQEQLRFQARSIPPPKADSDMDDERAYREQVTLRMF